MNQDEFRELLQNGNVEGVRTALASDPALARRTVHWFLGRPNESDPLHFVADSVGNGWLTNGQEGIVATVLVESGAAIDGTSGRESPLIGAASVGAERVARVLLDAGAARESTAVFGARALHWAAWTGSPSIVEMLVARGVELEARCAEFGATPLFWAVHGFGPQGPPLKQGQVAAARILLQAGARANTENKYGLTALELARQGASPEMFELLRQFA